MSGGAGRITNNMCVLVVMPSCAVITTKIGVVVPNATLIALLCTPDATATFCTLMLVPLFATFVVTLILET